MIEFIFYLKYIIIFENSEKINIKNILKYLLIIIINFFNLAHGKEIKIQGIVFDDKTNEKLIGANIFISDSGAAITNEDGFFTLNLAKGNYKISASMVGYKKQNKEIILNENDDEVNIFFRLEPQVIEIQQVTVNGEKFYEKLKVKTYEIQQGDLRRIPQFGETDALRAFQILPGVVALNDFSAQIYIRGGNFDETLISIDDVPVYNPYHLGSFFSMFNSDIIDKQFLYPSNYPNKFGGYLSGALDIQTKTGNYERTKGSFSIGLVSSKAYVEVPVAKGALILSARRTYLDLLASIIEKDLMPYYFYDFYGKYIYPINKENLLSFSVLYSRDNYKLFDSLYYKNIKVSKEPTWGNKIYNIKYFGNLNNKISLEAQFYYSSSLFLADGESESDSYPTKTNVNNKIQDISGLLKLNYALTGQNIQVGFEYKKINLNYYWIVGKSKLTDFGFELDDTFFDFAPSNFQYDDYENYSNFYINDKITFTKRVNLSIGLRSAYLSKLNIYHIMPSLNILYKFSDDLEMMVGFGKYYQNQFVIKDQNTILLDPFSVYFLPQNENQQSNSNNFNVNLFFNNFFLNSTLEISGYYNLRKNLASSYKQISKHYVFENGYSTGLELLINKNIGNISGWLSYSISRSIKSNIDYDYFSRIDRTNTIKILFNWDLSESWFFTSFWTFATGTPYTPTLGQYIGESEITNGSFPDDKFNLYPIIGGKNSHRVNSYHRLDVGINGSFFWGSMFIKPYFQIMNVYSSPNETPYKKSERSDSDTERGSSIIPTIGITIDF